MTAMFLQYNLCVFSVDRLQPLSVCALILSPQGVIISLKDGEGVIKSDEHGELPFDAKENFSDVEFTAEDVNEEVEFTVITVRTPPTAGAQGRGLFLPSSL